MTAIRALVVEDEPNARELLTGLLEQEPDVEVIGECGLGRQAVEEVRRLDPDVLFLDVRLPDIDGFGVLEELAADGEGLPAIVFVTAFDQFALKAFEVHAIDYLLKPFDEERLQETLEVVRERLGLRRAGPEREIEFRRNVEKLLNSLETRPLQRIAVKRGDESIVVRTDEIDWLQAEENYVRVHVGKQSYLVRSTLQALEDRLDPDRFVRLHRSTIANVDRIRTLSPWGHGDLQVRLADGSSLKASRRYRDRLDRVLEMLR